MEFYLPQSRIHLSLEVVWKHIRVGIANKLDTVMQRGAIITGASGSLGQTISEQLAKSAWDCLNSGRSFPVDSKNNFCIDLIEEDAAKKLIVEARLRLSSIDAMIMAHGIHRANQPDIPVRNQLQELLFSNFISVSELISALDNEPNAHVVVITSIAGFRGSSKGDSFYAASKAAVHGLIQSKESFSPKYLTAIASGPVCNRMTQERGYAEEDLLSPLEVATTVERVLESPEYYHRQIVRIEKTAGIVMLSHKR